MKWFWMKKLLKCKVKMILLSRDRDRHFSLLAMMATCYDDEFYSKSYTYNNNNKLFYNMFNMRRICQINLWVYPSISLGGNFEEAVSIEMRDEIRRLVSFAGSPNTASWIRLAAAGFFATGTGDATMCFSCNVTHSGWQRNDDPAIIHRNISPTCLHANENDAQNVPAVPFHVPCTSGALRVPENRSVGPLIDTTNDATDAEAVEIGLQARHNGFSALPSQLPSTTSPPTRFETRLAQDTIDALPVGVISFDVSSATSRESPVGSNMTNQTESSVSSNDASLTSSYSTANASVLSASDSELSSSSSVLFTSSRDPYDSLSYSSSESSLCSSELSEESSETRLPVERCARAPVYSTTLDKRTGKQQHTRQTGGDSQVESVVDAESDTKENITEATFFHVHNYNDQDVRQPTFQWWTEDHCMKPEEPVKSGFVSDGMEPLRPSRSHSVEHVNEQHLLEERGGELDEVHLHVEVKDEEEEESVESDSEKEPKHSLLKKTAYTI